MSSKIEYLVSACLCGIPCRYNGKSALHPGAERLVRTGKAVPVCPEVLGGLPIPREPVEIARGDGEDVLSGAAEVTSGSGDNMTPFLLQGALASLRIAKEFNVKVAWMKQRSPSCGCGQIKRKGRRARGDGVTTALLKREGIKVVPR
ncbi:MAG: DUF523 domain-containing protein [Candidatus Zixiibacteriota bacterium]|nr:MAG: DUF523 domain-containing protein [candidate division Zixibacteria bacterium]